MYTHACRTMIVTTSGKDAVIEVGMERKIAAIRDDLAGPSPSPLERILCERIALCWFDVYDTERRYSDQTGVSFKVAAYRESRRDRAHKRFLAACKALATVRRLGVPSLVVNQVVARQEVNVGTSA